MAENVNQGKNSTFMINIRADEMVDTPLQEGIKALEKVKKSVEKTCKEKVIESQGYKTTLLMIGVRLAAVKQKLDKDIFTNPPEDQKETFDQRLRALKPFCQELDKYMKFDSKNGIVSRAKSLTRWNSITQQKIDGFHYSICKLEDDFHHFEEDFLKHLRQPQVQQQPGSCKSLKVNIIFPLALFVDLFSVFLLLSIIIK